MQVGARLIAPYHKLGYGCLDSVKAHHPIQLGNHTGDSLVGRVTDDVLQYETAGRFRENLASQFLAGKPPVNPK